jgi:hypothetical protein
MAAKQPGDEDLECGEVEFEAGESYVVGESALVVTLAFTQTRAHVIICRLDVRMSTGTGELKLSSEPTTIYKRDVDVKVNRARLCFFVATKNNNTPT